MPATRPVAALSGSMEDQLGLHLKEYAVKCRANAAEMQRVWQDLEVSESARQVELGEAMSEACNAWSNALHRCTQQKAEVTAQISALVDQTSTIAEELGEASNLETRVSLKMFLHSTELPDSMCTVHRP